MIENRPAKRVKTGGRQKGSKNKSKKQLEAACAAARELVSKALPNVAEISAHTLLIATYRDPTVPLETRIDCAKAAIGFETPRLAAVDHTSNGETLDTVFTGVPRAADADPAKTSKH